MSEANAIHADHAIRGENPSGAASAGKAAFCWRLRPGAWALLGACWTVSAAAVVLRGEAMEWFAAAAFGLLAAFCTVLPRLAAGALDAVRAVTVPEPSGPGGHAGDRDTVLVRLTFRSRIVPPVGWIGVEERIGKANADASSAVVCRFLTLPRLRRQWTVEYRISGLPRGHYLFEPLRLTVEDPFGLTAVERRVFTADRLIVMPSPPAESERGGRLRPAAVERAAERHREPVSCLPAIRKSDGAEGRAAFAGMMPGPGTERRPYRAGDSLRDIDWRAAAKGKGWQTRLQPPGPQDGIVLAVETSSALYQGDDALLDAAAGWAVGTADEAVRLGYRVRLAIGGSEERLEAEDASAVVRLAERLAAVSPDSGGNAGSGWRDTVAKQLVRGGTLVYFTPDWQHAGGWSKLAALIAAAGCRLELRFVSRQHTVTFAMREAQKRIESGGAAVRWLYVPERPKVRAEAMEGDGSDGRAS